MSRFLVVFLFLSVSGFAASFEEGKAAFAHQDWSQAVRLLGDFVQEKPDDALAPSAAFLQAVALYQQHQYLESLDALQKMERAWPLSPIMRRLPYWKGAAALAAGKWDLAERASADQARYPDEEPFATRALLNLALARQALRSWNPAVQALQTFTQRSREPDLLAQAWFAWAQIDAAQDRPDKALEHWRQCTLAQPGGPWDLPARTMALDLVLSLKRWSQAQTLLTAARAAFPNEGERWDLRALAVARAQGRRDEQQTLLEALWKRTTDSAKKQTWALDRARVSEESGKPQPEWWLRASRGPDPDLGGQAIQRYAFWLENDKKWSDAASALEQWGNSHRGASGRKSVLDRAALDAWQANSGDGAARLWTELLHDYPTAEEVPQWRLGRGRWALAAHKTTAALEDFTRILRDTPDSPSALEAQYQTGLVYLAREEPARAESWFYGLIQKTAKGDLYERALLARGICFVNSGQTDLARASLQRLLREAPESPWRGDTWAALGRNALQARDFSEASDAYSQAESAHTSAEQKASDLWSKAQADADNGKPDAASADFARYEKDYPQAVHHAEARYRSGQVYLAAGLPQKALDAWGSGDRGTLDRARILEGRATALLQLGHADAGWAELETLEKEDPHPEAWYRWGQAATLLGANDWAQKAFETLLKTHPDSPVAEAALPRAAGALLQGGQPEEAMARYADYFKKFGQQASAAPVARAAAAAALPYPTTLETLVTAAKTWHLAPEVAAEFSLVWAQSRLDSQTATARAELVQLSQTAPWTTQRSQALLILGRWDLGRGALSDATKELEAASVLGDDLSVFKAKWALAQVTEAEGQIEDSARQRESTEKTAGPAVPREFRVQILKEAQAAWIKAGQPEQADRVGHRVDQLQRQAP